VTYGKKWKDFVRQAKVHSALVPVEEEEVIYRSRNGRYLATTVMLDDVCRLLIVRFILHRGFPLLIVNSRFLYACFNISGPPSKSGAHSKNAKCSVCLTERHVTNT
jgi:hypothetical protein